MEMSEEEDNFCEVEDNVMRNPQNTESEKEKKTLLVERRVDVYRKASIGQSLKQALKELMASNKIRISLANIVLEQFDRSMVRHLPHVPNQIVFTAEKLTNYGLMAENWKLRLKNVIVSEASHEIAHVNGCSILACVPEEVWI